MMFKKLKSVLSKSKKLNNQSYSKKVEKTHFVKFENESKIAEGEEKIGLYEINPISKYILFEVASKPVGWVNRISEEGSLRISPNGVSTLSPEKSHNPLKNYQLIKTLGGPDGGSFGKVGLYHKLDSAGNEKLDNKGKPIPYAIKTGAFKDPDEYGGNVTELKSLVASLGNSDVVKFHKAIIAEGNINFVMEVLESFKGSLEEWEKVSPDDRLLGNNLIVSDRRPDNTMYRDGKPVHIDLGQPAVFNETGIHKYLENKAIEYGVKHYDEIDTLLPTLSPSGKNDYLESDLRKVVERLKQRIDQEKQQQNLANQLATGDVPTEERPQSTTRSNSGAIKTLHEDKPLKERRINLDVKGKWSGEVVSEKLNRSNKSVNFTSKP